VQVMQPHTLGVFWGSKYDNIGQNLGEICAKVIKIWTNLIRFGQNQNLLSQKH